MNKPRVIPCAPGHGDATPAILAGPEQEELSLKMMEFLLESKEFSEPRVGDMSLGVWGHDTGSAPASPMSFLQEFISKVLFHVIFLP